MQCIANRNCQVRMPDGRAHYFTAGQMGDFDKCPNNFTPAQNGKLVTLSSGTVIDFSALKDDVVRALEFDPSDLKAYMKETLPEITWAPTISRDNLVEKYLYARAAVSERKDVLEANAAPVIDPIADAVENNENIQLPVVEDSAVVDDLDSLLED